MADGLLELTLTMCGKRYAEALRKVGYRLIITKKRVIVCREPLQTSRQDKSCTSTRP